MKATNVGETRATSPPPTGHFRREQKEQGSGVDVFGRPVAQQERGNSRGTMRKFVEEHGKSGNPFPQ
jgi:hypothetical protein